MMSNWQFRQKEREAFREAARLDPFAPPRIDSITPEVLGKTPDPDQPTDYSQDQWIKELRFPIGNPANEKAMAVLDKYWPAIDTSKIAKFKGKQKWGKKSAPLREAEVLEVLTPEE